MYPYFPLKNSGFHRETRCGLEKKWRGQDSDRGPDGCSGGLVVGTTEDRDMATKEVAPKSVQSIRKTIRKSFLRGVDKKADVIVDQIVVWLIDDIFAGRVKTRRQAAEILADGLADVFGKACRLSDL